MAPKLIQHHFTNLTQNNQRLPFPPQLAVGTINSLLQLSVGSILSDLSMRTFLFVTALCGYYSLLRLSEVTIVCYSCL